MAANNTEKIKEKNVFYKHGTSKEKYPVFYLIARRFIEKDPDMDKQNFLYYILKVTLFIPKGSYLKCMIDSTKCICQALCVSYRLYFIQCL